MVMKKKHCSYTTKYKTLSGEISYRLFCKESAKEGGVPKYSVFLHDFYHVSTVQKAKLRTNVTGDSKSYFSAA